MKNKSFHFIFFLPLLIALSCDNGNVNLNKSNSEKAFAKIDLKNSKTKVLGVSVLTSLDNKEAKKYYNENSIEIIVKKFVKEAKKYKISSRFTHKLLRKDF